MLLKFCHSFCTVAKGSVVFHFFIGKNSAVNLPYEPLLGFITPVVRPAVQDTYKPCRYRKCIQGHVVIFAVFIYFFIPVLSRPSFTSTTLNKDQKIEQLFYFQHVKVLYGLKMFKSSVVAVFVHAICMPSKKVPCTKIGSHGPTPMIQPPFYSLYVLHYEPGMKFSIEQFLSYMSSKNQKFQYNRVVYFVSLPSV